jgi:putative nucleotidyltransferase with HDIG domain
MIDADEARRLAYEYLAAELPRRWAHVQAVAARATELGSAVADDCDVLVSAAWLHDIGYAPSLVDTGFHPLDGARFLRRRGLPDRVVGLVAHHTCAIVEAEERGLAHLLLGEFEREASATADLLSYCDLTTGPDGERVAVEDRLRLKPQRGQSWPARTCRNLLSRYRRSTWD